ncbi:MAG: HupE/UreJ family protein [Paracoccaceae bacterium]
MLRTAPKLLGHRLAPIWLLSSLLVLMFSIFNPVIAHEIRPATADVTVTADRVEIDIILTLETLVAGLDLSELEDTNASPLSERYDMFRAMGPDALAAAFRKAWPEIGAQFQVRAGDMAIGLDIFGLEIPEVGDIELVRESVLRLGAQLPVDDSPVTVGWAAENGPLVVRQVIASGDGYSGYLTGGEHSIALPRSGSARQGWFTSFTDFIGLGFQHIIPKGLDHILFVLGLFFFSLKLRPLLTQVTAFTIAHTVTLASAALGIIQVPPSIVEPLIAASIVYVAVENILMTKLRPWRTAVVFGFGLLHGLGFASVLGDIGLDPARFFTGLIGFNIGVELGQLAVISAAFLVVGYWFGTRVWYRAVIAKPASLGIAIMGAYWFVQRVFF